MAGEPRKTLGERMNERMEARRPRSRGSSHVSSFHARFGLASPRDWANQGAAASATLRGETLFALLRRIGAAESRREARFSRIFGRDARAPFQRIGGEKQRFIAPSSLSGFGAGDFLLIKPSTQLPVPEQDLAEQPVQRTPTRKPRLAARVPKLKTSRAVSQALAPRPRPRKSPRLPTMDLRGGSPVRERRVTSPRAERRERSAESFEVQPVLRTLERIAAALPEPEQAANVRRLAAELRHSPTRSWTTQIRATLRRIGVDDGGLVAEVESALPDALVRPVTMAMSRVGDRPERGLKPVTRRSPLVRAAAAEAVSPATRAVRKARAGAERRSTQRSARARVVASPARSSRRAAGPPASSADGPEGPSPAARPARLAGAVEEAELAQQAEHAPEQADEWIGAREPRREAATARVIARSREGALSGTRWADAAAPSASARRATRPARRGAPASARPAALIGRVSARDERTASIGLRPTFYGRLGLAEPAGQVAAPSMVAPSEAPRLERLAASRARRDAREQAFEAAHAGPRAEAVRRLWPGERARRAGLPTLAPTDLLLPRAPEAAPVEERAPGAATPSRAPSRVRALAPVLGRARAASPARPAAPSSAPLPGRLAPLPGRLAPRVVARPAGAPAEAQVELAPEVHALEAEIARATATRERAALRPRPMDRVGERLEASVADAPAVRVLKDAALGSPSVAAVQRVVQAIEAISEGGAEPRARAVAVRRALRELGPVGRVIAAEVEAALPAAVVRPDTVAQGRLQSAESRGKLGLRPVLHRSPSLVELLPPAPVAPASVEAEAKPAARPSRVASRIAAATPSRAARLSASPVQRATAARPLSASPVLRAAPRPSVAPTLASTTPRSPSARPGRARAELAREGAVEAESGAILSRPSAPLSEGTTVEAAVAARAARPSARAMTRALAVEEIASAAAPTAQALAPARSPEVSVARAVSRLDVEREGRSVLPRVTPSAEAALRRSVSRALGGFAPEQSLVRPDAPIPASEPAVAPSPTRRAPAPTARHPGLEPVAAPKAGSYVPVRVIEAIWGAPEASSAVAQRPGAVLRASTRGEAADEASRSLLPGVTPRLDRALAQGRTARRTLALSGEIVLPTPGAAQGATEVAASPQASVRASSRAALAGRAGSLMPAVAPRGARVAFARGAAPRTAFSELGGLEAASSAERRVSPVLGVGARAEAAPAVGYTASRAPHGASARLGGGRRGALGYVSAPDAVFARPQPGPAEEAAPTAAGPRALDRVGARQAALSTRPVSGTLARLQRPASATSGVVRLLSEARAVEEVLSALSRGPTARDGRVRRVSASARQLLGEVLGEGGATRDSRSSRAALIEVHSLLSDMMPSEPAARAARVVPGRTRRAALSAPELRLPSQAAAQAPAETAPAASPRARTRLAQIRALRGTVAPAEPAAPAREGRAARRSRLEPRPRLSARTPTAEALLLARPEGVPAEAGARRGDLGQTLGAVGTGELGPDLPGWANRSVGETRVRGTVGGLMDALARARSPGEVVRAMERRDGALRSARTLPAPVLRLIDEIRAEASAEAEAQAAEMAAAMGLPTPVASRRRGSPRAPAQTSVFRGFTNLSRTERTQGQDGLGADRLMKLVRKLQQLVFLADSQRDAAMRQVRLAEDSASARSEGQAAPTQSGDSKSQQVDVEALAQEVLQHVQREMESRSERRQDDPDNRSPWW